MVHVNNDWVPKVLVLVIICYRFLGGSLGYIESSDPWGSESPVGI